MFGSTNMPDTRFPPLYGLLIAAILSLLMWVYGLQLIGVL